MSWFHDLPCQTSISSGQYFCINAFILIFCFYSVCRPPGFADHTLCTKLYFSKYKLLFMANLLNDIEYLANRVLSILHFFHFYLSIFMLSCAWNVCFYTQRERESLT